MFHVKHKQLKINTMKKKLTYRAHNEQGVQIDKIMTTGDIS